MEGMNSSEIRVVVGSDAPSEYHEAPRTDNSNHVAAGTTPAETSQTPAMVVMPVKKKRGRPRKYGLDGAVTKALSPKPIPTAAPPSSVIDFSSQKPSGKVRPAGSASKHYSKTGTQSLGDWISCSVGSNFTPHIITVNAGEDVTMKVISFSQQGPRGICILSANGIISSVTLRQLDSSGGTMTYEGRFEILSLTGSFMPSENGGIKNRSGGVNVSLASADGRVVGGVAGLLVAASPVQVVVGSFLTGNQHEQKLKKPKTDSMISTAPAAVTPITSAVREDSYGQQNTSETVDNNNAAYPSESMTKTTDVNKNLPG